MHNTHNNTYLCLSSRLFSSPLALCVSVSLALIDSATGNLHTGPPRVTSSPVQYAAEEDGAIRLECLVQSVPPPTKITWSQNGQVSGRKCPSAQPTLRPNAAIVTADGLSRVRVLWVVSSFVRLHRRSFVRLARSGALFARLATFDTCPIIISVVCPSYSRSLSYYFHSRYERVYVRA